jgi:hypothetical protein
MSLRIGIGKNLKITPLPSGIVYEPEIVLYISGLVTPLSDGHLLLLNDFVAALKADMGITALSDIFDALYVFAGETEESSLRNLVKRAHDCTAHGTYVYTATEGFTGDAATAYLDSHFKPSTEGVNLVLNNAGFGFYNRLPIGVSAVKAEGVNATGIIRICPRYNATEMRSRVCNSLNITHATVTSLGMRSVFRYGANSAKSAINKTLSAENVVVSVALPIGNICFLAENSAVITTPINFDDRQLSMGFMSRGLVQAELDALYDNFQTYMTAYGKQV